MKKTIRILAMVVLLGLLVLPIMCLAVALPQRAEKYYVNDFAGVLGETSEEELCVVAKALASQPECVNIVIVTIKSYLDYGYEALGECAKDMYNTYIGENEMSLLILLSTTEKKTWVAPGREIRKVIPDDTMSNLVKEYASPHTKQGNFEIGLISLQKGLVDKVEHVLKTATKESEAKVPSALVIVIVIIAGLLIVAAVPGKKAVNRGHHGSSYSSSSYYDGSVYTYVPYDSGSSYSSYDSGSSYSGGCDGGGGGDAGGCSGGGGGD